LLSLSLPRCAHALLSRSSSSPLSLSVSAVCVSASMRSCLTHSRSSPAAA
jgi:hypothetical protein